MIFFCHFDAHHPLKTEGVKVSEFKITDPGGGSFGFYYRRPLRGWGVSLWLVDIFSALINRESKGSKCILQWEHILCKTSLVS
jgi:hypothetical protein